MGNLMDTRPEQQMRNSALAPEYFQLAGKPHEITYEKLVRVQVNGVITYRWRTVRATAITIGKPEIETTVGKPDVPFSEIIAGREVRALAIEMILDSDQGYVSLSKLSTASNCTAHMTKKILRRDTAFDVRWAERQGQSTRVALADGWDEAPEPTFQPTRVIDAVILWFRENRIGTVKQIAGYSGISRDNCERFFNKQGLFFSRRGRDDDGSQLWIVSRAGHRAFGQHLK